MRNMHIMLKPASGLCNMACRYCFYADETQKRSVANHGLMSEETLRNVLSRALENVTHNCTISFQGGEPTLAGLAFFQKAVRLSRELNVNRCRLSFSIQTNGLLLDEEWCSFFARERFLVGLSLDGPKELHDANRVDREGRGTYNRVLHALHLLRRHRVSVNILTVVTGDTSRRFRHVYQFFRREGLEYQQYIPCLDPLEQERGTQPWSLSPPRFERYLKTAFDCWYQNLTAGRETRHRYFDNLLLLMDAQPPEACGMLGVCGMQYVVEADGSVYPCDFYMLDPYCLGNLNRDTIADLDIRREKMGFVQQSLSLHPDCRSCQWLPLCRGGCRRDRDLFQDGIGKNYYCSAYQGFFSYAWPRLEALYRAGRGHPPRIGPCSASTP